MEARRDVFQAIADPTRRQIINMIARESMNLNSVAEHFEVSRQAISLHIKILIECGLIDVQQQGRERICTVQAEKLSEVEDWLTSFRSIWEQRFERVDTILDKMKKAKKTKSK